MKHKKDNKKTSQELIFASVGHLVTDEEMVLY